MSTLQLTSIESRTSGAPPVIKDLDGVEIGTFCRAWVNFNGTGTVAIRAAFNVSSITDYGTGLYGVYYTNTLSDNYMAVVGTGQSGTSATGALSRYLNIPYSDFERFTIITGSNTGTTADYDHIYAAVFR